MATKKGHVRVTFGNRWTGFDGKLYEQGKTYSLPADTARHVLAVGKARHATDDPKPVAVVQNNSGTTVPDEK
jgi:hypothetical protein